MKTTKKALLALSILALLNCGKVRAGFEQEDFNKALATGQCRRCELEKGNFSKANLMNVNFTESDLEGADFTGAILTGANFYHADLDTEDGKKVSFRNANLTNANFQCAKHFYKADFTGAIFNNTTLPNGKKYTGPAHKLPKVKRVCSRRSKRNGKKVSKKKTKKIITPEESQGGWLWSNGR